MSSASPNRPEKIVVTTETRMGNVLIEVYIARWLTHVLGNTIRSSTSETTMIRIWIPYLVRMELPISPNSSVRIRMSIHVRLPTLVRWPRGAWLSLNLSWISIEVWLCMLLEIICCRCPTSCVSGPQFILFLSSTYLISLEQLTRFANFVWPVSRLWDPPLIALHERASD